MRLDHVGVARRMVLSSLAPLLAFAPPARLHAAPPLPFTLAVPESFISLSGKDASTLFVAGNFRTGTTLSVQRVAPSALRASSTCDDGSLLCEQNASVLAAALAAYRDSQAAPSGSKSELLPGSARIADGKLTFEMVLALASGANVDPELSRRTAVAALPYDGELLCLWAGAKLSEWDAGDGALLVRAAQSFALAR